MRILAVNSPFIKVIRRLQERALAMYFELFPRPSAAVYPPVQDESTEPCRQPEMHLQLCWDVCPGPAGRREKLMQALPARRLLKGSDLSSSPLKAASGPCAVTLS